MQHILHVACLYVQLSVSGYEIESIAGMTNS